MTPEEMQHAMQALRDIWQTDHPDEPAPDWMQASETAAFADASMPDGCFAFVPAEAKGAKGKKSLRKLPLCADGATTVKYDKGRVSAAKAAFSSGGLRGQRVQLPSGAVAGARAKVNAAAKALDLEPMEAAEGDMPEERPSRDYLAAFWTKLKELAGSALSKEDFDAAHRTAMSSAGGKATARKRAESKTEAVEPSWFAEQQHNGFFVALWLSPTTAGQLAIAGGEPAELLHVTLCYCGDVAELDELAITRAIAAVDRTVSYRAPLEGSIAGYGRFNASPSSDAKDVFYASVDAPGLTDLRQSIANELAFAGVPMRTTHDFTPHITLAYVEPDAPNPVEALPSLPLRFAAVTVMVGEGRRIDIPLGGFGSSIYNAAAKDGAWGFFSELPAGFAEAPDWVNVLPVPNAYSHPIYGQIAITKERNQRFLANFSNRVYQQDLPITIDIEHNGKMSGAQGYIEELRLNEDGSVDAKIAWTERGRQLIEEDKFRHFSPEWFDEWRDPASGTLYQDVLIGGAICVRPFFKEGALRPLVASEGVLYAPEGPARDPAVIVLKPLLAAKEEPIVSDDSKVVQLTEAEVQAFREAQAKVADLETQLKTATEEKQATDGKVAKLEADAREKRFTDLVMGRGGGSDGAVWIGSPAESVKTLVALAEKLGEESEEFTAVVARFQEDAKALKESGAFTPIGTSEGGETGSAWDQIEAKAKVLTEADPKLSRAQAIATVAEREPQLYREYEAERRG